MLYKAVVEKIEHDASTVLIYVAWSTSVFCHDKSSEQQQPFPLSLCQ
jgi:hypothetical protein